MVPPDSHGISRAPCYLGTRSEVHAISSTGVPPSMPHFQSASTMTRIFDSLSGRQSQLNGPTTPTTQRLPAITRNRFSLFRFRSPLLTESRLLSLPEGTEMFHFPSFPPHALYIQARVTGHDPQLGFPIRKSSDHSSVASSPRLIAGSYVLHRLLVPRHPPCALKNLTTKIKMLASTVQFSSNGRNPDPVTGAYSRATHHPRAVRPKAGPQPEANGAERTLCPFPQDPTACQARHSPSWRFHTPPKQGSTDQARTMKSGQAN